MWWLIGATGLILFWQRKAGGLGLPIEGEGPLRITPNGHFGAARKGPPAHPHQGVDVRAPAGSNVLAMGDGVIVKTNPGLGKIVRKLRLTRPMAWMPGGRAVELVVYADLGTPLVAPGDRVQRGQPIALVDKAGFVHVALKSIGGGREEFFDPKETGLPLVTAPRKEA